MRGGAKPAQPPSKSANGTAYGQTAERDKNWSSAWNMFSTMHGISIKLRLKTRIKIYKIVQLYAARLKNDFSATVKEAQSCLFSRMTTDNKHRKTWMPIQCFTCSSTREHYLTWILKLLTELCKLNYLYSTTNSASNCQFCLKHILRYGSYVSISLSKTLYSTDGLADVQLSSYSCNDMIRFGRQQQHSSVILRHFCLTQHTSPTNYGMRHQSNCRRRTTNAAVAVYLVRIFPF